MSALTYEFDLSQATMLPPIVRLGRLHPEIDALTTQWEAVHEAAAAVAQLAQLGEETAGEAVLTLPVRAAELGGWHYEMTARGIDDLAAVMRPGLRALLALTARGKDTTAAALTLWNEFYTARTAILARIG